MNSELLPKKHLSTSESLIGIGAVVLTLLKSEGLTLERIWEEIKTNDIMRRRIHGSVAFDNIILAVDFLFTIGIVRLNEEGHIERCA
jgi:hypothetical protein